jgi:hypothetical protein
VWDPNGTPQELDDNGNVLVPGSRVVDITLSDGTPIVQGGNVVAGNDLAIATIDFLARGGDQYPYRGAPFTSVGVSYQQALANYIVNGLNGVISAADYPEGGEGRITEQSSVNDKGAIADSDVLSDQLPEAYALHQNYPNPFNPTTTIAYDLPEESNVTIAVYNITGQKVMEVFSGKQVAGVHQHNFDASNLSSGIYLYTIKAGNFQQSRKMILTR